MYIVHRRPGSLAPPSPRRRLGLRLVPHDIDLAHPLLHRFVRADVSEDRASRRERQDGGEEVGELLGSFDPGRAGEVAWLEAGPGMFLRDCSARSIREPGRTYGPLEIVSSERLAMNDHAVPHAPSHPPLIKHPSPQEVPPSHCFRRLRQQSNRLDGVLVRHELEPADPVVQREERGSARGEEARCVAANVHLRHAGDFFDDGGEGDAFGESGAISDETVATEDVGVFFDAERYCGRERLAGEEWGREKNVRSPCIFRTRFREMTIPAPPYAMRPWSCRVALR